MEINLTGRLRRMEQSVRTDGTKKGAPVPESSSPGAEPQTDSFSAARQAVAQLEEQSQRLAELLEQSRQAPLEQKKPAIWDIMGEEESNGDAESEILGESLKVMKRCQEIAARIMRGDKVPPQDERYLMMNDPDGYKLAMAMRTPKKRPKKCESVLDDEDKTSQSDSDGSEEDAVASSETSDAGGDGTAGE